jgi:hypothetical protein
MTWFSNLIPYGLAAAAGVVFFTVHSHQSSVNSKLSSEFGKTFGSRCSRTEFGVRNQFRFSTRSVSTNYELPCLDSSNECVKELTKKAVSLVFDALRVRECCRTAILQEQFAVGTVEVRIVQPRPLTI